MGFNKRFINKSSLEMAASQGLDYLIKYIRNPDALTIEYDGISGQVCDIIRKTNDRDQIKESLKNIGFYEFH